ncbi:ECE2 [Symbiodinium sp. CCMP2592]|nr:ECE2 [Symbiodinium sp. CCMP2592]
MWRTGLDENAFDLAVDKGTLDYLLCGEVALVLSALRNVRTALAPCGILLVVSIHPLPLWQAPVLRWHSGSAKTGSGYANSWSCIMRMGRVLGTWAALWMTNSTVLDQHENDYVATCPKGRAQALQRHAKSSS